MCVVPMCLVCGENEVVGEYALDDGRGYCSRECEQDANEVDFRDLAPSDDEMENMYDSEERVHAECEEYLLDDHTDLYDNDGFYDNPIESGMYDDDPDPYSGTYSEE